ncbi:MAG: hypothetical protein EHM93_15345 [Bacteroidales bacterium]|nr:MAG: hypothetical protein EHM93_15345 [Bacteroidales bacterium]
MKLESTKWNVYSMNNEGVIDSGSDTWNFDKVLFSANSWIGGYSPIEGNVMAFDAQIQPKTGGAIDSFKITLITSTRFIATKGDQIYRFGKKL